MAASLKLVKLYIWNHAQGDDVIIESLYGQRLHCNVLQMLYKVLFY